LKTPRWLENIELSQGVCGDPGVFLVGGSVIGYSDRDSCKRNLWMDVYIDAAELPELKKVILRSQTGGLSGYYQRGYPL